MSGELERRWDDAVETAWRELRQRLADRLAEMAEDESLVVELAEETSVGAAPYCQVLAGPGVLRVEAVSNVYLAEEYAMDVFQEGLLKHLGFAEPDATELPGNTNFWIDLDQREADRAAVMMVRALREVYAVVHPVYLSADGLLDEVADEPLRAIPPRPRPEVVVHPEGPDEVRAAVDLAVRGLQDERPEWDEDGDLPLDTTRGVVWVTIGAHLPRILLHAPLVGDVVDEARALVEVNLLNQREFGLTFSLRDGQITVFRELDASALVPAQLRLEIERLTTQVDRWAGDLVTRVGGRCMDEQTPRQPADVTARPPAHGRFATAYGVMVELERGQRGSVGPATIARIFDNDTGLLLKAVRINEQRRREMRAKARAAREEGRGRAEQVARARQEYLRELTARMRAALRLIVDAPVRKVQLDQMALFDEDECGTGR
ncbi:type III secretion system chaperone [Nocardioides sp. Soil805]|uniref:type III secretion system chaperone n=1 Tax=Nocardioides sp. Soil805 TaxID=1736416 RepID=UPI0007032673|nr:type III secretion system chaperone [Nocardioides sp. Soil805]KRF36969.1 hypothetical protein ASG94_06150 [Nocardioides sp. Soil805]